MFADIGRLPNQLIQTLLLDDTLTACVRVRPVICGGSRPIQQHAKPHRLAVASRSHDQVQIAREKAKCYFPGAACSTDFAMRSFDVAVQGHGHLGDHFLHTLRKFTPARVGCQDGASTNFGLSRCAIWGGPSRVEPTGILRQDHKKTILSSVLFRGPRALLNTNQAYQLLESECRRGPARTRETP